METERAAWRQSERAWRQRELGDSQREHEDRESLETERAWRQRELGDSQREHGDRESLETETACRQRELRDSERQHTDRQTDTERACQVDRKSIHTERYAMLTGRTPRQRKHEAHGDRPRERANYCIHTHIQYLLAEECLFQCAHASFHAYNVLV